MRILMVHNRYLQRGGEEECFELEAEMLARRGHDVTRYEQDNKRIADIGTVRTAARATWSAETYQDIRSLLKEQTYDVVHVHGYFPLISPSVHWAARGESVPTVQTLHNYRLTCANGLLLRDGAPCEKCLGRTVPWPAVRYRCYRNSRMGSTAVAVSQSVHNLLGTWTSIVDAFICPTSFVRSKMTSAGLPADRLHVKPNFLWPDPGLGRGGRAFVFVGRLSPEKGVGTLLRAWQTMEDPPPLDIIGDGPLQEEVQRAAGAKQAIRWLGRLALDEVVEHLKQARAAICPSECYETFGRTGAEAMAVGTPVIGANMGAIAEMVRPGVNGLLFEPGSAEQLADRVRQMLTSEPSAFRAEARRTFESRYTEGANYEALTTIYGIAKTVGERTRSD